jgi:hypothetical protein
MMNPVGVWRRYQIVSSSGTQGTYLQRLLVFTTARKKAPDGLIEALFRRYLVDLRSLRTLGTATPPHGIRRVSSR